MKQNSLQRQIKVLELDKILNMLSQYAAISDTAILCNAIKPKFRLDDAKEQLVNTSDAYSLIARFGAPSFGGASNVDNALARASAGSVLNLPEFLKIAATLRVIRGITDWREHFCSNVITSLNGYFEVLQPNKYFEEKIYSIVASEEELNDNASVKLADIRRKIRSSSASIREKLDKMVKSQTYSKFLQESIVTQRDGRYVVPVKAEYRSEVPGLIHDTSGSGATLFVEPMAIVEVNNELRVLRNKEREEIERILKELSEEAATFAESIVESYKAAVALEVIFCKAKFGFDLRATVPELNDKGIIDLKNARHPLLGASAVPIDVNLGLDFDTLVITGPNTGGKTVTLKTVGLLTLMALCGMMIPADDGSKINVYSKIFADIGDEQSIEQSLSTFSSHIKNIVEILEKANDNSLVLLDELGAGTDPVEGAALAKAIIMRLKAYGTKSIVTTHYPELKSFALDTNGVENACCEFDVETLKPTYKLLIGVPGRSNAFAISQKLGIEESIIATAKEMVSEENKRFEELVSALEEAKQSARKDSEEIRKTRIELDKAKAENIKLQEAAKQERERLMEKTRQESENILESARLKSNELLNQLEDIKKQITSENASSLVAKAREAARASIKHIEGSTSFSKDTKEKYVLPRKLIVGDTVILQDINKKAEVVTLPDKNGKLTVIAGIMKMQTDISNIRLQEGSVTVNNRKPAKHKAVSGILSRAERNVITEIDLRGMACDEAIIELERFIDNAIMGGMETVHIIHGKGTGVLRKGVQTALKQNKNVKSFRLGVFGEGESGVTIATLK